MAENTRTTPAEMIHEANVGLIISSLTTAALVERAFFVCRSLLDSRDLRLVSFGGGVLWGLAEGSSSDSGTKRSVVGCMDVRVVDGRGSGPLGRTAAAQDSRVVREARNAAS